MTEKSTAQRSRDAQEFAEQKQGTTHGVFREFFKLLRYHKKWWLTPIIVALLLFGVLIFLTGSPLAPLIYTLF